MESESETERVKGEEKIERLTHYGYQWLVSAIDGYFCQFADVICS